MRWIRRQVGWIAAAAVGGFLLWLIATAATLRVTQAHAVGTLFGQAISADAFQKALQAVTHDAILRYGDRFRQETTGEQLSESAWERLMLAAEAKHQRIRVSDREVVEELRNVPLFQTADGRFDFPGYQGIVRYSLETTPRNFEEEIREGLMIRKLLRQVVQNPPVMEEEILEAYQEEHTAIRVASLPVPHEGLAREVLHALRQDARQMEEIARQLERPLTTTAFFKRGDEVKDLALPGDTFMTLFRAEPGQVDGPIRTSEGWLIARLEEKRTDPSAQPTEGDRERLKKALASRKQLVAYLAWYQDLLKRAGRQ